jgi:hypothetical protein
VTARAILRDVTAARTTRRRRLVALTTLAASSLAATALLAEFAVRAAMPAGRLLSPDAIDLFAERAAREATMIRPDDELGHAPVPGGEWYDEHGVLRLSPRADGDGPESTFLFLGDSVTRRGSLIKPLAELWNGGKATFWNAGVESWNPTQEVAGYFRSQRSLKPQRIVLTLHNNDLTESTVACLKNGVLTLCNPGSFVPVDPAWYRRSILYELLVHFRHTDRLRPEHYTFREREVEAALARLRDDAASDGALFSIVLLPIFAAPDAQQPHERRAREQELAMLERLRVPFVDLQPVCDEIANAGLDVRVTPTDPYHPDDACGAMLAAAAADLVLGPAALPTTALPRVVSPGATQSFAVEAGVARNGLRVALVACGRGPLPTRDDDEKNPHGATATLDANGRAVLALPGPEGAAHGDLLWHRAVVLAADDTAVLRGRPQPMRVVKRED